MPWFGNECGRYVGLHGILTHQDQCCKNEGTIDSCKTHRFYLNKIAA